MLLLRVKLLSEEFRLWTTFFSLGFFFLIPGPARAARAEEQNRKSKGRGKSKTGRRYIVHRCLQALRLQQSQRVRTYTSVTTTTTGWHKYGSLN